MTRSRVTYLHPDPAARERASTRLDDAFEVTVRPASAVPTAPDGGEPFADTDAVVVAGAVPDAAGVCRRLRERRPGLGLVLFAPRDGPVAAALAAGADDYVPSDGAEGWSLLTDRLERLLDGSPAAGSDAGDAGPVAGGESPSEAVADARVRELHAATRDLVAADSSEEIAEVTVDAAKEVLGLPVSGVRLIDDTGEYLLPAAMSADTRTVLGDRPEYRVEGPTPAARAFRTGETVVIEEPADIPDDRDRSDIVGAMYLPLGEYGTLSVAATEAVTFDDDDRRLAGILADNAGVALASAERRAELAAERDRLETFASVLSHDLRNPLNVATGHVELAAERDDVENLGAAADALDRMRTRIDSLLALAREGDAVVDPQPVSLAAAARRAWAATETNGAALDVRTDRYVVADGDRLERLLENLFRNSIEHGSTDPASRTRQDSVEHGATGDRPAPDDSADHGAAGGDDDPDAAGARAECDGGPSNLTVTVVDTPEGFVVADDGVGFAMPPGELFDSGVTTNEDGTGLGLAIVERIADAHGWGVSAGEREDGGARFAFTGVAFAD